MKRPGLNVHSFQSESLVSSSDLQFGPKIGSTDLNVRTRDSI